MKKILIINGPNLNFLGIRDKNIYGSKSYQDLIDTILDFANKKGIDVEVKQNNSEGEIVNYIQQAYFDKVDGIVINPAAYTHTSIAILDALLDANIPFVEVHISDVNSREDFRKISYIGEYAIKRIIGHGLEGYLEAIEELIK